MLDFFPPLDPMPPIPVKWVAFKHPGSFGLDRHQHVHTGVDLYAPLGCPVRAMEAGRVVAIKNFTGPSVNMPWWEDTRAVYVEGKTGVFNYGEIQEWPGLKVGSVLNRGDFVGHVLCVLKKFKGRPMSIQILGGSGELVILNQNIFRTQHPFY